MKAKRIMCCINCEHWHSYMDYSFDKYGDHVQFCDLKVKDAAPDMICGEHVDIDRYVRKK